MCVSEEVPLVAWQHARSLLAENMRSLVTYMLCVCSLQEYIDGQHREHKDACVTFQVGLSSCRHCTSSPLTRLVYYASVCLISRSLLYTYQLITGKSTKAQLLLCASLSSCVHNRDC